ncbi:hypothetical protein [Trichothermofontia sp.]
MPAIVGNDDRSLITTYGGHHGVQFTGWFTQWLEFALNQPKLFCCWQIKGNDRHQG